MAAAALCLIAQLFSLTSSSDLDVLSGVWKPIPRERVYNWNLVNPRQVHSVNGYDLIQVVDGPKTEDLEIAGESEQRIENQGISIVLPTNRRHFDMDHNMVTENYVNPYYRRGKKLHFTPNIASNNIANDKIYENTQSREIIKELNNSTYEVVENTDELAAEQNIPTRENNYGEKKGNNLTVNLLKILSNYNIQSDDALPNYALSLKREGSKSHGHVYMRVPYRYNSQNHAPVDPVLAVLLSNYGHYLPGWFGHQHNYRNLYGYSASNNIHNNKPFGAYKIFADTDSALK